MRKTKIKKKKAYSYLELSFISWELADLFYEKYKDGYILKNKATRRGVLKCLR